MASSCSGSSCTLDNSTTGRDHCFDCMVVVPGGTFGSECVSRSGSGDGLRPSRGGLGSFADSASSGTGTRGSWLDVIFFVLKINNVRMRNQERSIQDAQRKHDDEAYASVFIGIDAFMVREIALGHRGYGDAVVYAPNVGNRPALLIFYLANLFEEVLQ